VSKRAVRPAKFGSGARGSRDGSVELLLEGRPRCRSERGVCGSFEEACESGEEIRSYSISSGAKCQEYRQDAD
jgi:hypothetical protein